MSRLGVVIQKAFDRACIIDLELLCPAYGHCDIFHVVVHLQGQQLSKVIAPGSLFMPSELLDELFHIRGKSFHPRYYFRYVGTRTLCFFLSFAYLPPQMSLLCQWMCGYLFAVNRVNNQLAFGDAYRADLKHVFLGYYVLIALPLYTRLLVHCYVG